MHGLNTRPPRLAPWLLAWTLLSAAAAVSHLTVVPYSLLVAAPAMTAGSGGYYLARLLQRQSAITRESLAGGGAWPAAQLFPGPREHACFARIVLGALCIGVLALPSRAVAAAMRPAGDGPARVLMLASAAGLAVNVGVLVQAARIVRAEDGACCAAAHAMRCSDCRLVEGAPASTPVVPPRLVLRPTHVLGAAIALTLVLLCTMQAPLGPDSMRVALSALPVLALAHHVYFLRRSWHTARASSEGPTAEGGLARALCFMGHAFCAFLCALFVLGALLLGGPAPTPAPVPTLCVAALAVVHALALVGIVGTALAEARARCGREGHAWACMRYCTASEELAAQEEGVRAHKAVTEGV